VNYINYINNSLYKCILIWSYIDTQTRLPARDHYILRESVTRIYFDERDQTAVLRLSQHRFLMRCDRAKLFRRWQTKASNCGIWVLYELAAYAVICVGVENAVDQAYKRSKRVGSARVNCLTMVLFTQIL